VADSTSRPQASVIVLNYNAGATLDRCIESLLAQEHADYELLLVDNASTDGSTQAVEARFGEAPRLRIIRSATNTGCAGGRNLGMRHARGELFCFVDSDAFAEPTWLGAIVDAFQNPAVGVVASRLLFARNPRLLNGLGGAVNAQGYGFDIGFGEPVDYTELASSCLFASGNGLCARREVVDAVGGFDEVYFNYYEDVEFCLRARRAGYDVVPARDAILYHWFAGDPGAPDPKRLWLCERNRIRTVLKHFSLGRLLRWLPREIAHEWRCREEQYPRGTFPRAWLWNLARAVGLVRARLSWKRPRLALAGRLLPTWGHIRYKGYNLRLRPEESRWADEVRMGREDEGRLLYGWHYAEQNADGLPFRWTDDIAALGLRLAGPSRTFELEYFWAVKPMETFVYLHHPESRRTFWGRLPAAAPLSWTRVQTTLELPAGDVHVILQTPAPYEEAAGRGRRLGVAVRHCRLS
jgi:GT2 family glycosyltransferase